MFLVDRLILLAGVLLLLGVASSKVSSRLGLPFLVVFIAVGMLAGSEGIGGIPFENYPLAHGIGTLALAVILFDGGLRTSGEMFRSVWAPSLALATVGVLVTSLLTGLAVAAILDVPLLEGLLLGSIVGSTDAAAVFAIFRSRAMHVKGRLAATLEVESGSNDPMAIFMTVALLQILTGAIEPGLDILWFFALQMASGAVAGFVVGWLGAALINRIQLEAAGLYPVLGGACGLIAYGVAASIGGSGFLSVYVAGIVLGNSRIVFRRGLFLFHDGLAWLSQLVMFVMLGLLIFPTRLMAVAPAGLLVSAILIVGARPAAVALTLLPFRYRWREIAFVAWAGLKGAVPIILAIYPFLYGLPAGLLLFNVVFFVVLVSAVTQGWTLPAASRLLGLQEAPERSPPVSLEITSLRHVEGDIVEYAVTAESRASGRLVRELALPDGAIVALIARGQRVLAPRGSTRIEPGDFVFVLLQSEASPLVDRVFASGEKAAGRLPEGARFPLLGRTRVRDLEEFYGITTGDAESDRTLDELLRERLGDRLEPGAWTSLGSLTLVAREIEQGRVESVELVLPFETL